MDRLGNRIKKAENPTVYDFAFVGGGASAQLMLLALHHQGILEGKEVLILDPVEKNKNDRTWSFWTDQSDPAWHFTKEWISAQWSEIEHTGGRRESLAPYQYVHLRAADFYRGVKDVLGHYNHITRRGEAVEALTNGETVMIKTATAKFKAHKVFDSRPPLGEIPKSELLWQSFVGWRVSTEQAHFDPARCRLMDFQVPQMGQTQFMYFLPTSPQSGLLELTRFGRSILGEPESSPILHAYLNKLGVEKFKIEEKEINKIPMTLALGSNKRKHAPQQNIIPLGTRAGVVKGSTGFAFKAMAQHAQQIVDALLSQQTIPSGRGPWRFRFYDELLLRILSEKPHYGSKIFQQLFEKIPSHQVLRFLEEKSHFGGELKVMWKVPWFPFLWSLSHSLRGNRSLQVQKASVPEKTVLGLTLILLVLQSFQPKLIELTALPALIAGLAFPGLPHGALDLWVARKSGPGTPSALAFTFQYLLIMALVVGLWLWQPGWGLLLFLLYSFWHFGETDLRSWGKQSASICWLWGKSSLSFLLLSHWPETEEILKHYLPSPFLTFLGQYQTWLVFLALVGMLSTGFFIARKHRRAWLVLCSALIAMAWLPLLWAFGLYFILNHSLKGWRDLKAGLGFSGMELVVKALPYTAGAFALGAAGYFLYGDSLNWDKIIPWMFIFIAAISAPHIYFMHRFYRKTGRK